MDAVIDIGSNSVRLMTDDGKAVNRKTLASTTLADGLALTGYLSDEAMDRTAAAIRMFVAEARRRGADNIYVFGTEAMRAAKNGKAFKARLEEENGLTVDVISGETEARLGLMGAAGDIAGEATVVDIGGASVEIVRGNANRITYAKSAPLGMVRLIDLVGSEKNAIERFVERELPVFGIVSGTDDAIAIGGTATSLASMDLRQTVYNPNEIHGHILTLASLSRLRDEIFSTLDLISRFPTLTPNRARVIGHGAIMLLSIVEYLGLEQITVSEHDNMEGYLTYIRNRK